MRRMKLWFAGLIAHYVSVSSPKDSVVLYSVSFLPTQENRDKAFKFVEENKGWGTLGSTLCGKLLLKLGLENGKEKPDKEIFDIWVIASKRFISKARGKMMAFVDGADPRSTFVSVELPLILENPAVTTINGENKTTFAKRFKT